MQNTQIKLEKPIPFFKPSFSEEEEEAVCRILRSGWLTTGSETLLFEKEFKDFTGAENALAVNSASSGLILAMDALGIKAGTKILTTPYTFISTATSALHLGAEVAYADIEKSSYSIDVEKIEDALKKDKTIKAVVPVHIAGLPCNMKDINFFGQKIRGSGDRRCGSCLSVKNRSRLCRNLGGRRRFFFLCHKDNHIGRGRNDLRKKRRSRRKNKAHALTRNKQDNLGQIH